MVALWLYAVVGLVYATATLRRDCRRSERLRAACEFNLPSTLVAVAVIAMLWPLTGFDDVRRWARRRRARRHWRRLAHKAKTQSVCTADADRPTV